MIVCDIAIHCSNQKMQRDLTFRWNDKSVSKFFEACFRPYFTQLLCKKTANKVLALIALSAATEESILHSAALAVTGAWKGRSCVKLFEELGWESLNLCRWYRRLVLFISFSIISLLTTQGYHHESPRILFILQLQLA